MQQCFTLPLSWALWKASVLIGSLAMNDELSCWNPTPGDDWPVWVAGAPRINDSPFAFHCSMVAWCLSMGVWCPDQAVIERRDFDVGEIEIDLVDEVVGPCWVRRSWAVGKSVAPSVLGRRSS